jgi:threonine dehydrogenase-like Zn-dependent dehydrogenase
VAEAYRLIFAGEVDADRMISHRLPLAQYAAAFDLLLAEPKRAYKVVFVRGE